MSRLTAASLQVAPNAAAGYESDKEEADHGPAIHQSRGNSSSTSQKPSITAHDRRRDESTTSGASQSSVIRQLQPTALNSSLRNSLAQLYGPNYARMDSFARHQKLTSDYHHFYGHSRVADAKPALPAPKSVRSDADVLRDNYRFVRSEADDADLNDNWEQRMAKRYYDRLFREYAIVDLTRYKEGKVGLRWRTDAEVFEGRGQFTCANKHCASPATAPLQSFELNFVYAEAGVTKQSLVKVRVCADCAYKLHYNKFKQMEEQEKQQQKLVKKEKKDARKKKDKRKSSKKKKENKRNKRNRSSSSSSSSSDSSDNSGSDSDASSGSSDVEIISSSSKKARRMKYASDASSASKLQPQQEARGHDNGFSVPQSKLPSNPQSQLFAAASSNRSSSSALNSSAASSSAAVTARVASDPPPPSPTTERNPIDSFFQQYFPSMFP